ncbi:CDP-glycerol glycerophosphotransferase family protein [Lacticaseibacillus sp. N501-2]|uniref:CDP-glycerol glycerophosphotransferase family protein n=1 Tax=Lacticaseibacillus salsurae TaxID=3367729 RepID=UPI0038B3B04D
MRILKFLGMFLSVLIPRSKNRYVFGAWFGTKFSDNPKYQYLYVIKNRPDIKPVWITKSSEVYQTLVDQGLPVEYASSFLGIVAQLRAKYVFICTSVRDVNEFCMGNAVFINQWHGIPLKKIMYDDSKAAGQRLNKQWKLSLELKKYPLRKIFYLATSETFAKIYQSAFRVDEKHIRLCGQSRNDVFFEKAVDPSHVALPDHNKTILYMPTHRESGKVKIDVSKILDLPKLQQLMEYTNSIFIIKKHYYHNAEPDVTGEFDRIVDFTGTDVDSQGLEKNADILITDYSSCYIDFLLLNRPIVFFDYDLDNYLSQDRDLYFDYSDVTPGFKTDNFLALHDYLKQLLTKSTDEFEKMRKDVRGVFYSDLCIKNSCEHLQMLVEEGSFD